MYMLSVTIIEHSFWIPVSWRALFVFPLSLCIVTLTTLPLFLVQYNCGKVCLSLLGTWQGGKGENWDPNVSTMLQVRSAGNS